MLIWFLRIIILIGAPIVTYFNVSPDIKGITIGIQTGALIVLLEFFCEHFLLRQRFEKGNAKILDLSSILDGRVIDICETHFIYGDVMTPRFIINELQSLSRSKETILRARGRRGLDILSRFQESKSISFKIIEDDVVKGENNLEKLAVMAKKLHASVITTDFNTTKACALHNVRAMNVNDLALALKPIVLPGDDMTVFVMKEGKDNRQGIGYLDDGTMIVVRDGKNFIGDRANVIVQSILQTSQGRIIFTTLNEKENEENK